MTASAWSAIEIVPGLWLGNLDAAMNRSFLLENRITCVINCTDDCPFVDINMDLLKIRVPVRDNGRQEEMDKMFSLLDIVADRIQAVLRHRRILVHCLAGKQRSVAVILAYIMKYADMTLQEAIDVVRSKKSRIGINFSPALSRYQLYLRGA